MYQLIYVSTAIRDLNDGDLNAILEFARRNNEAASVTGMLLFLNGEFLQVLEGAKNDVLRIFDSIKRDNRHRGVIVLTEGDVDRRSFDNWTMGFRRFDAGDEEARNVFKLSRQRLGERIPPDASREVLTLMRTFYRIASGEP